MSEAELSFRCKLQFLFPPFPLLFELHRHHRLTGSGWHGRFRLFSTPSSLTNCKIWSNVALQLCKRGVRGYYFFLTRTTCVIFGTAV
jgi:hypothetical protein